MQYKTNEVKDTSQISCYRNCPRLYRNQYLLGLTKHDNDATTHDRRFGSCVHGSLAHYYRTKEIDLKCWDEFIDLSTDDTKTHANGRELCKQYFIHYKPLDSFEVLAVECPVQFELGGFKYLVKLDLVVRVNGNVFVVEHKTTKNIGGAYFSKFQINSQISAQTYACTLKFGECAGVIVNALSLKNIKKDDWVILDPDHPEVNKYSHHEIKYSSYYKYKRMMAYCWGITFDFRREIINRTPQQVEDFKNNVIVWMDKMTNDMFHPKNEHFCSSFKGCEFKKLCYSCDDEQIKEQLYKEVEDPYAYMFD